MKKRKNKKEKKIFIYSGKLAQEFVWRFVHYGKNRFCIAFSPGCIIKNSQILAFIKMMEMSRKKWK